MHRPRVLVSYAVSPANRRLVVCLCDLLRRNGVVVELDFQTPPRRRHWGEWFTTEVERCDFVLVIASPEYRRAAEGGAPPDHHRPTGGSAPGTTAPAGDPRVWSSGSVFLGRGGADLDSNPPVKSDDGTDIRKDEFTEVAPGPGADLIEWPGKEAPAYKDCRGHVESRDGLPLFDPAPGSYFCVRTNEQRISAVRYGGIVTGGLFRFDVTTWEK